MNTPQHAEQKKLGGQQQPQHIQQQQQHQMMDTSQNQGGYNKPYGDNSYGPYGSQAPMQQMQGGGQMQGGY